GQRAADEDDRRPGRLRVRGGLQPGLQAPLRVSARRVAQPAARPRPGVPRRSPGGRPPRRPRVRERRAMRRDRSSLRALRLACLLEVLGASNALAQSYWEAGVGLSAVHLPDYRGSDEAHGYLLPFPY